MFTVYVFSSRCFHSQLQHSRSIVVPIPGSLRSWWMRKNALKASPLVARMLNQPQRTTAFDRIVDGLLVSFSCFKNLWVSKVLWCSAKCWQQIAWQAWDVVNDKLDPEAEFKKHEMSGWFVLKYMKHHETMLKPTKSSQKCSKMFLEVFKDRKSSLKRTKVKDSCYQELLCH